MKLPSALSAAIPLACLLISYVPVGKIHAEGRSPDAALFCAVAEHPENYRGRTVRLRATYNTDSSHYEYLKLPSCARNAGVIDIGKHGQSESVKAFYAETKKICTAHNAPVVCIISAQVDVVGLIREWPGDPGHFVIDLDEINQFRLDQENLNK